MSANIYIFDNLSQPAYSCFTGHCFCNLFTLPLPPRWWSWRVPASFAPCAHNLKKNKSTTVTTYKLLVTKKWLHIHTSASNWSFTALSKPSYHQQQDGWPCQRSYTATNWCDHPQFSEVLVFHSYLVEVNGLWWVCYLGVQKLPPDLGKRCLEAVFSFFFSRRMIGIMWTTTKNPGCDINCKKSIALL